MAEKNICPFCEYEWTGENPYCPMCGTPKDFKIEYYQPPPPPCIYGPCPSSYDHRTENHKNDMSAESHKRNFTSFFKRIFQKADF